MTRRKPRGRSGQIIINLDAKDAQFVDVVWPDGKEELENMILCAALRSPDDDSLAFRLTEEPERNPEDHFDFSLQTTTRKEYLDLMEFAPLELIRGSYNDAAARYLHGDMADWVHAKVMAKGIKYRSGIGGSRSSTYIQYRLALCAE